MPNPLVPATRRDFIKVLTGAVGVLPTLAAQAAEPAAAKVPIVDAHLHCFAGKGSQEFPYHAKAPYQPDEAAPPERLLACMDGAGVDHAVVVHPEPYQDDHRYLEHCMAVCGKRVKGTALVFAEDPASVSKLAPLAKKLSLVATRIHATTPARLPPFGKPELRNLWRQAGDLGLAVQLHFIPKYAPGFEPLIREFPSVRVIVDHLGRPLQGTPEEHAVVMGWGRFPNTIMKICSLPKPTEPAFETLVPITRRLVDAFGADRMIYGGGFSAAATPETYRAVRENSRRLVGHLSASDQAKVLGGTAARLFGFG